MIRLLTVPDPKIKNADAIRDLRRTGLTGLVDAVQVQVELVAPRQEPLKREHRKISSIIHRAGSLHSSALHRRISLCARARYAFQPVPQSENAQTPSVITVALFCGSRHCPYCAKREIAENTIRFLNSFARAKIKPLKFITLTCRNVAQGNLRDAMRALETAWVRLRKDHLEKHHNLCGYISKREVTMSKRDGTWHPHIHAVCDLPYLPKDILAKIWRDCATNAGLTASYHATRIDALIDNNGQGAYELAKYCSKPISTTATIAHQMAWGELIDAWHGQRSYASGGSLKLAPKSRESHGNLLMGQLQQVLISCSQEVINEIQETLKPSPYELPSLVQFLSDAQHVAIDRLCASIK